MITAQVSLYPQKTTAASEIINKSIEAMKNTGVQCDVGSMSTNITGTDEQVWKGLRTLFDTAQKAGETNMVVTITNAAD